MPVRTRVLLSQVDFGSELEAALAGDDDEDDDEESEDGLLVGPPALRAAVSRRRAEKYAWRAAAVEWMQGAVAPDAGAFAAGAALRTT